ncbi:DUF393 domain-containing protein [Maribellus luteus]|uniref:DUF393 domain-containing protein n=1 Tax=Maribellus luteus TaxID=2305463 RepID=A0A399SZT1_9BACT|nr:DCC1-like thiol-disulfide oxidoreductase family protein [Maribellus luteus]RIJ48209.1 DUF393 domain-containing protein [Maribellus luteus]
MRFEKNIILFDGVCNLCNYSVDFVLKRDRQKQFYYVSLQSEEGKKLVEHYRISLDTDSVILIRNTKVFTESEAAIEIARMLPVPWKWLSILRFLPRGWRDGLYRWVARNRYRWFGKRENCRIIQN